MIAAIEADDGEGYWVHMRLLALRLLMLVAVAILPLGMAAAPAAPIHHQQMMAGMPMEEHCPDKKSPSSGALADCTMACAAALPAADLSAVEPHAVAQSLPEPSLEPELSSLDLEIATPPPRAS